MPALHRLARLAKILATVAAWAPAVGGLALMWQSQHSHEPNPGAGNMPSFFPAGIFLISLGIVFTAAALPLVVILPYVWLGRRWAFLASGIICLAEGAFGLQGMIGALARGQSPLPGVSSSVIATTIGVTMLHARRRLPVPVVPLPGIAVEIDPMGNNSNNRGML